MPDRAGRKWTRRHRRRTGAVLGLVFALGLGLAGGHAAAMAPLPAQNPEHDGPQLPGGPPVDPGAAREQADEILARDEFQGPEEPGDTIIERIRRWLSDRLPDVDGPDVGSGPGDGLAFVVVGVVVLGGLAAIVWTVSGARRSRRPDDDADVEVDVTPLRSADEWGEEAERCLREGDHRGAVRARYRSLTATLARRGLVADTPGRTAGEQRDDVGERAPDLTPAFDAVATLFERVWFGAEPVGPAESDAARDLADRALAAAPRRAEIGAGAEDEGDDG